MKDSSKKIIRRTRGILKKTSKKIQEIKDRVQALKEQQDEHAAMQVPLPTGSQENVVRLSAWSVMKSTLTVIGVLCLVWLLFAIKHILVLLFVSILIAAALDPVVDRWEKYRIPRSVSVLICYFIGLIALIIVVSMLLPMMITQIGKFSTGISASIRGILVNGIQDIPIPFLPQDIETMILTQLNHFIEDLDLQVVLFNVQEYSAEITQQLSGIAGNFWGFLTATFNGVFNALLVLIITFFLIVDKAAIRDFFHSLLPTRHLEYVTSKTTALQRKIGSWVRGQLLLCFAVGIVVYIGLWILSFFGVDIAYKETLAVVAGLTEIIPVVGPIIGTVPAILIAMNTSFVFVLWVIFLYFIVQQLENNILVPVIMNHAVGLSPVVIIIVMLIGAQFFGILGVILAIPVTTSIAVFVKDYANKPK